MISSHLELELKLLLLPLPFPQLLSLVSETEMMDLALPLLLKPPLLSPLAVLSLVFTLTLSLTEILSTLNQSPPHLI